MLSAAEKLPLSGDAPKSLVFFLHGLGADGNDLLGLADQFADALPNTQFIAPNAAQSYGGGFQWFKLYEASEPEQLSGIERAASELNHFIDNQLLIHKLNIADAGFVGFSQGSMMAFHALLRRSEACAAIVAFSGKMMSYGNLRKDIRSKPPVCLIHGSTDDVVPFAHMADAEAALLGAGVDVESHLRPGLGHAIDTAGIRYARSFLEKYL